MLQKLIWLNPYAPPQTLILKLSYQSVFGGSGIRGDGHCDSVFISHFVVRLLEEEFYDMFF